MCVGSGVMSAVPTPASMVTSAITTGENPLKTFNKDYLKYGMVEKLKKNPTGNIGIMPKMLTK